MKKTINFWQFIGFALTSILGTLFHFIYDWSNHSVLLAPFVATNESTWEHMKLLFFPMLIFAIVEYFYIGKEYKNFWGTKLIGISLGITSIPIIYYTYTGIFGVSADWFNIAIFFVAAIVAYATEARLLKKDYKMLISSHTSLILICILAFMFVIFTFIPPTIPLFKDPVTNQYGINNMI